MKIKCNGFTLIEILIVLAIICLLASCAIHIYINVRDTAHRNKCVLNLKTMERAKVDWANETKTNALREPYLHEFIGEKRYIREIPACDSGGYYFLGKVGKKPTCTIPGHTI